MPKIAVGRHTEANYNCIMASLADLISGVVTTVQELLGDHLNIVADEDVACRIIGRSFTIRLAWDWRDKILTSSICPHSVPGVQCLPLDADVQTDIWLQSQGQGWPVRQRGRMTASQISDELVLIETVLRKLISDPQSVRDGLFFNAGYTSGYTDSVSVPEFAPPASSIARLVGKLRT